MKRITLFFALLLTATTMMAEEFTLGKFTFQTHSYNEVELVKADQGITSAHLSTTITYQGKTYSVTSIGDEAFHDCSGLTSVTIPNSVTSIGDYAFKNCSSLTSVTIPNSVTSLGTGAFRDCSSLTSITIPESVTSIGLGATFQNCTSLKSVQWNAIRCKIDKNSNGSYYPPFYNLKSIENFVFGNYVTFIPECLCSGLSGVSSITIPNSVTSIGTSAFYGCSSLMSITIPESVTSIGEGSTFQNCTSLKSVQWNAIRCKIDKNSNGSYYPPFYNLKNIENFVFGNYVTFIPECLCSGLSGVTSITIPNSVTSIGDWAFNGCSALTSITIPNSVTSIGDYAFEGCSSLTLVNIPSYTELNKGAFPEHTKVIKVAQKFTIGKLIYEKTSKTEVKIVEADTSIISADITPTITYQGVTYIVTSIGDHAFDNCRSLKFIIIPESVTRIGNMAFEGCFSLESVIIPSSAEMDGHAFPYGIAISTVDFRVGLLTYKKISSSEVKLVKADKRIINAHLSSTINYQGVTYSVTSIGDTAFNNCSYLTSITIPNSVTSIGDGAFAGCVNLPSITIPNSVISIGAGAFAGCVNLPSITIPNSVTSIRGSAFSGCSSLTSISIPNSVTRIGEETFAFCSSLTSITIPNSVTSIGDYAFACCSYLTSISIPNSVTSIGDGAFAGCYSLTSVIVPTHTEIGPHSFPSYIKIIRK